MTFIQPTSIDKSHTGALLFNANIPLAGVALLFVFAVAICLAATSPGTAHDALASMTVLP